MRIFQLNLSQLLTDSASKNISEPQYDPDVNSSNMSSEDYSTIFNSECGTTTMISVDIRLIAVISCSAGHQTRPVQTN